VGHSKTVLREKFIANPHQKIREISNKQSGDVPQNLGRQEQTNYHNGWKEIIKIRATVNKLETISINETKAYSLKK
jgi:hypothetical protein